MFVNVGRISHPDRHFYYLVHDSVASRAERRVHDLATPHVRAMARLEIGVEGAQAAVSLELELTLAGPRCVDPPPARRELSRLLGVVWGQVTR